MPAAASLSFPDGGLDGRINSDTPLVLRWKVSGADRALVTAVHRHTAPEPGGKTDADGNLSLVADVHLPTSATVRSSATGQIWGFDVEPGAPASVATDAGTLGDATAELGALLDGGVPLQLEAGGVGGGTLTVAMVRSAVITLSVTPRAGAPVAASVNVVVADLLLELVREDSTPAANETCTLEVAPCRLDDVSFTRDDASVSSLESQAQCLLQRRAKQVRVLGHVEDREDATLALRRAETVRAALVRLGVDAQTLKPEGARPPSGSSQRDDEWRSKQRRVELLASP